MNIKNSGVTLVELLVVMAIMGILAGIVGVNYFGVRSNIEFENQLSEIAADLSWTRSRSIAGENGSQWGIYFKNSVGEGGDFYEIWYGDNHTIGTVVERKNLKGSVAFSDPQDGAEKEVIFLRSTGSPDKVSTISLYSLSGTSTGTIDINSQGRIDIVF